MGRPRGSVCGWRGSQRPGGPQCGDTDVVARAVRYKYRALRPCGLSWHRGRGDQGADTGHFRAAQGGQAAAAIAASGPGWGWGGEVLCPLWLWISGQPHPRRASMPHL